MTDPIAAAVEAQRRLVRAQKLFDQARAERDAAVVKACEDLEATPYQIAKRLRQALGEDGGISAEAARKIAARASRP